MISKKDNFITVTGVNLKDGFDKGKDKLKVHIEDSMVVLPLGIRLLHYFPILRKYYLYKLKEANTKKFK
jgi:hypothetical protein